MKSPPAGVKLVMAAVCVMKDIKPDRINDPSNPAMKVSIISIALLRLVLHVIMIVLNSEVLELSLIHI